MCFYFLWQLTVFGDKGYIIALELSQGEVFSPVVLFFTHQSDWGETEQNARLLDLDSQGSWVALLAPWKGTNRNGLHGEPVLITVTSDPTREPTAWWYSCRSCLRNISTRPVSQKLFLYLIQDRDYFNKQSLRAWPIKAEPRPFSLSQPCPTPTLNWNDCSAILMSWDREREGRERCECLLVLATVCALVSRPCGLSSLWVPRALCGPCAGAIRGLLWNLPLL